MPIIRRKLDENTVYPSNLRYNAETDTVQSLVNGSWVDNPSADPRNQTYFPPRASADPQCDAAASVVAAYHAQIDQIIDAINNASSGFTIAGIILSFLEFGPFAVLIDLALLLANTMITAGASAIEAALTEPVWEQFQCILFCQFDSSGKLKSGGLAQAESDTTDQIGGLAAIVLNALLQISGEGGVGALAATGTATGDCSACECGCGDEEIAYSLVVFFGTEIERNGCNIKVAGANDGGHDAVTITWDGSHPWQLTREGLISGDTGVSHWQWYTWDGSEHGPFTGGDAPLNVTVTTIELFGDAGHTFSTSWDVRTPPP